MKIALVAGRFPVLSETFIYNHAAYLRAAGVDVTVLAARPKGDDAMFADYDGTKYDGPIRRAVLEAGLPEIATRAASGLLRSQGVSLWDASRRRYGMTRRAFRAWMLALPIAEFDLVHFEYSGLAIRWLDGIRLLDRTRTVLSCRGASEQIRPLVDGRRAGDLREVFAAIDRVHCVSDDMLRTCHEYGLDREKAFVNRPAIDPRRFHRSKPYQPRTTGPYRLLSTGRLHWKKGLEFALVAIRQLVDRGHGVHYTIVGGGDDEERLRFAVRDLRLETHVTMTGRLSSNEVRDRLETADVYLLPSVSEGLSNAALEAMAMEVPVVATTAGGMNEAIGDGVDGLLVAPRDPSSMARAIEALIADPGRRHGLGRAARARVERDFSLERQVAVYLSEYRNLIERTSRAA